MLSSLVSWLMLLNTVNSTPAIIIQRIRFFAISFKGLSPRSSTWGTLFDVLCSARQPIRDRQIAKTEFRVILNSKGLLKICITFQPTALESGAEQIHFA